MHWLWWREIPKPRWYFYENCCDDVISENVDFTTTRVSDSRRPMWSHSAVVVTQRGRHEQTVQVTSGISKHKPSPGSLLLGLFDMHFVWGIKQILLESDKGCNLNNDHIVLTKQHFKSLLSCASSVAYKRETFKHTVNTQKWTKRSESEQMTQ